MLIQLPRTEKEKIALILEVVRWPNEPLETCVERLIDEEMLPRLDDQVNFRRFVQENVSE